MKDESRELIEQYKDMYQKLNEQSIFSLRTYGREIGVAQPTLKEKEELIIHIIKIMNGLEAPAKQSNIIVHGILERQEYNDHIRAVCSPEVQVWEQALLEQGILCKHGRREQASRTEVYPKPRERGFDFSTNQHGGVL